MPVTLKVIEDSTIISMANNAIFVKEFPFLERVKKASRRKSGCSRCQVSDQHKADIIQKAKQGLAGLASSRKARLKTLLDAKKVRVIYRTPTGKVIKLTF